MTNKQRFGHVNATKLNSYLTIVCICIKLVYTSERKKTKKLKFGLLN